MKKEEWVMIGVVGVDSGQLMICDPCYIENEWKKTQFEPKRKLRVVVTGEEIPAPNPFKGVTYESEYKDGMTYNEAVERGILEDVPEDETGEFSYDGCCKATINKSFGQLHYDAGHAGAGVVFTSGWGDGVYEVWAKFKDFGEEGLGGKRITEVRVILIDDKVMDKVEKWKKHWVEKHE